MKTNNLRNFVLSAMMLMSYNSVKAIEPEDTTGHWHIMLEGPDILPTSETWQSTVVFKNGSDYTFEKKGTFTITKGVVVEKGAKLKVINSTANY